MKTESGSRFVIVGLIALSLAGEALAGNSALTSVTLRKAPKNALSGGMSRFTPPRLTAPVGHFSSRLLPASVLVTPRQGGLSLPVGVYSSREAPHRLSAQLRVRTPKIADGIQAQDDIREAAGELDEIYENQNPGPGLAAESADSSISGTGGTGSSGQDGSSNGNVPGGKGALKRPRIVTVPPIFFRSRPGQAPISPKHKDLFKDASQNEAVAWAKLAAQFGVATGEVVVYVTESRGSRLGVTYTAEFHKISRGGQGGGLVGQFQAVVETALGHKDLLLGVSEKQTRDAATQLKEILENRDPAATVEATGEGLAVSYITPYFFERNQDLFVILHDQTGRNEYYYRGIRLAAARRLPATSVSDSSPVKRTPEAASPAPHKVAGPAFWFPTTVPQAHQTLLETTSLAEIVDWAAFANRFGVSYRDVVFHVTSSKRLLGYGVFYSIEILPQNSTVSDYDQFKAVIRTVRGKNKNLLILTVPPEQMVRAQNRLEEALQNLGVRARIEIDAADAETELMNVYYNTPADLAKTKQLFSKILIPEDDRLYYKGAEVITAVSGP